MQENPNGRPKGVAPPLDRRVLAIAVVVVLGAIMTILDTTLVAVAIDTLSRCFSAVPAYPMRARHRARCMLGCNILLQPTWASSPQLGKCSPQTPA